MVNIQQYTLNTQYGAVAHEIDRHQDRRPSGQLDVFPSTNDAPSQQLKETFSDDFGDKTVGNYSCFAVTGASRHTTKA